MMLTAALFALLSMSAQSATPPKDAKATEQLWKSRCAGCHGADGAAATAMGKKLNVRPASHPEVQKMTDAQMCEVTAKGKGKMPKFEEKLTKKQIEDLVSYMRGLGKKKS